MGQAYWTLGQIKGALHVTLKFGNWCWEVNYHIKVVMCERRNNGEQIAGKNCPGRPQLIKGWVTLSTG